MIKINGESFYEIPGSCGSCPFFNDGTTHLSQGSEKGLCRLFNEMHKRWINTPARCKKLFNKAFKQPDGSDLVIVIKEE